MQASHPDTDTRKLAKRDSPATWLGRDLETYRHLCALDGHASCETCSAGATVEQSGHCVIALQNSGRRIKPTRNRAISCSPPPAPPEPNLPVPRVRFSEKRSAEDADLASTGRANQSHPQCARRNDGRRDRLRLRVHRNRPDLACRDGRWKKRRNQQYAHVPRVTSAGCLTTGSASHHPRAMR